MSAEWEEVAKVGLAVLLGAAIGAERELHDRAAGFRTIILVCVGATLFAIYSPLLGSPDDPVRITAAIVSGVGFLGAGVIIREPGNVSGLTTAATVWVAAAIGVGIGGGMYILASVGTAVALIVLSLFYRIETRIDRVRELRSYSVVIQARAGKIADLEQAFRGCGLVVRSHSQAKQGDRITCSWIAAGPMGSHDQLVARLFEDPDVDEFRY